MSQKHEDVRQRLATLTAAQRAHLMRRVRSASQEAVLKAEHADTPASWSQQHLWFLEQFEPAAGTAYRMAAGLRLQGPLDRDALKTALDALVARHEVLRTTLLARNGELMQRIAQADSGFHLLEHDLSDLPALHRQTQIQELCACEAHGLFDLSSGPLIRGRLLRLDKEEHLLLITQHHIISDGWSTGILLREIAMLYGAFSKGRPSPLPALAIQYADYARWQRRWLQGPVLHSQVEFWKSHLSGSAQILNLPTDRARPARQSYAGDRLALQLPAALIAGLRTLSQRHGATLFMVLLAGWSALLSRLSGQTDLVIGAPVANRQRGEFESLIGFFANTLALRVRLDGDPSAAELLRQIKNSTLQAYAHQDIPFATVVEALRPPRNLSHNPIFQAALAFDNVPGGRELSLAGLRVSRFDLPLHSAKFDLTLALRSAGEDIDGVLEYATDLFDRTTIEHIGDHLLSLLEAMVANDRRPISTLNILSAEQRETVLVRFNDTDAQYPRETCVHDLIEEQSARTPQAIAVVFGERQVDYARLNAQANRVAHHLIALGVRPDDRVAICLERSIEMVIAVIAVLKAGGAYVPLDPAHPHERLAYILMDSAPVALLTSGNLRDQLPRADIPIIDVDLQGACAAAAQPEHNPDRAALALRPTHLAYLIYTSGSTGLPKGVMVQHASVVNLLKAMAQEPGLSAKDVLLAVTTLSFDIAALELYLPLIMGARLVLASRADAFDARALSRLMRRHAVTVMQATPATWRLLLDHDWREPGLRALCGGEALTADLANSLSAATESLWNLYGPTETTIWSTMTRVARSSAMAPGIGRPLPNTRIYILDQHREPVPIGVVGEIHIGGAGVSRGYFNRTALTAERFLPDRFSTTPDARMYSSGDLGRWRPDGSIEYLGRNDFQVKLHGFRIELGEIESQLMKCPAVRETVVVARADDDSEPRLVAYVTAQGAEEPTSAVMRNHLSALLPAYMIPSAFIVLETLPLTLNGKLDRQALPAPNPAAKIDVQYAAPLGELETTIAAIWQQLLGVPRVGRHDNFFELGGHSLLLLKVISSLRAKLGRAPVMAWLFQAPTPAQLAATMGGERSDRAGTYLVVLNEGNGGQPLFCLHGFGGHLNDYTNIVRFMDPSVPIYGLQVDASAQNADLQRLLHSRMRDYEREIRSVQPHGPYRLCGYSFGGSEAFDLAMRLEDAGDEVLLILLDAYRRSKALRIRSWLPRILMMVRSGRVLATAQRKLCNLFAYEMRRWLTGRDRDLTQALRTNAKRRRFKPFAGRVVLFKSDGFEDWAYQPRLDGFNGWKKLVAGRIDVIRVHCGHERLVLEPAVTTVVQHLNAIL